MEDYDWFDDDDDDDDNDDDNDDDDYNDLEERGSVNWLKVSILKNSHNSWLNHNYFMKNNKN